MQPLMSHFAQLSPALSRDKKPAAAPIAEPLASLLPGIVGAIKQMPVEPIRCGENNNTNNA
jgi:hypothetical protein